MQINNDWKKMAASITAVIGLLSSILTFFTSSFNNFSITLGIVILLVTILTVFILVKWMPRGNLPDGMEDIVDEMDNVKAKARFKIIFPCDDRYYKAANSLAKEKFGKNSVSTKKVNDWKKRNEFLLTCLVDNNRMVGYFDIVPLKNDFAHKLIKGEVGEKDITAENILGAHEIKNAEYIYFAGIAVQHTQSGQGCIHGTYLLASAIQYVKLFYGDSKLKKILTIPTSECGLKITKHLKFVLEREGSVRKDGFDLYSKEFKLGEISDLIHSKQRIFNRFDMSAYPIAKQRFFA